MENEGFNPDDLYSDIFPTVGNDTTFVDDDNKNPRVENMNDVSNSDFFAVSDIFEDEKFGPEISTNLATYLNKALTNLQMCQKYQKNI